MFIKRKFQVSSYPKLQTLCNYKVQMWSTIFVMMILLIMIMIMMMFFSVTLPDSLLLCTYLFKMFVNPFCESLLLNGIAFVCGNVKREKFNINIKSIVRPICRLGSVHATTKLMPSFIFIFLFFEINNIFMIWSKLQADDIIDRKSQNCLIIYAKFNAYS